MARGKYTDWLETDGLARLEAWARDGLTMEQIAHNCGCALSTLSEWKTRFPEISDALKRGSEVVDIQVENALLRRALGYEYTEEMREESEGGVKVRRTTKFVPPDVTAQIFWLKNRRPEAWRDKPAPVDSADGQALQKASEILRGVADALD